MCDLAYTADAGWIGCSWMYPIAMNFNSMEEIQLFIPLCILDLLVNQ